MLKCPAHLKMFRVQLQGEYGDDFNGAMVIKPRGLKIIFSSGMGWEHVSISKQSKTPSYEELDRIKREFWEASDVVMQLHVAKKDHVNNHDYCLHLWRPLDQTIPTPPLDFV